jgi:hypothetical protein
MGRSRKKGLFKGSIISEAAIRNDWRSRKGVVYGLLLLATVCKQ